jgi:transcriptional antiterminator Rof (Rho-off)
MASVRQIRGIAYINYVFLRTRFVTNSGFLVFPGVFGFLSFVYSHRMAINHIDHNSADLTMEQEYVLEWLDQMVYDLHPLRNKSFDNHQSLMIIKRAKEERDRSITYLKQVIFQQAKDHRAPKVVDAYFNTVANLIENGEAHLLLIPVEVSHLRSALEVVLSCLDEVRTFIVARYSSFLDPDKPIKEICRIVSPVDFPHSEVGIILSDYPQLYNLLYREHDSVFGGKGQDSPTLRQVAYWKTLIESLHSCKTSGSSPDHFSHVEMMLIERNFNSPGFVKYITDRMLGMTDGIGTESARLDHLAFLNKSFNQIPAMKEVVYCVQHDDLQVSVTKWLVHEIEYRSKAIDRAVAADISSVKSGKYLKKNAEKILCKLTVDQLALFFKAADQAKIITARSLSAIFNAVAPHLSTPHKEEISRGSLRTKSYSVEERDKEVMLEIIGKLAREIEDL